MLLKHFLFGKINPHSLGLRSASAENFNSLGHLPLRCSTVALSVMALRETTQELGRQDAWPSVCGVGKAGVEVTANTPITNPQQIYFQFYMTQAILNEWPETRGKLCLHALLWWATVHSMAGQTHLSPGRNPVRPGFPDVSGLEHPFLLSPLNPV